MQKNFLISSAIVAVITAMIGFGQYSKEAASQRRYEEYQKQEQEEAQAKIDWWTENSSAVAVLDSNIKECLGDFKAVRAEIKGSIDDVFKEFITYRMEYLNDSTARAAAGEDATSHLVQKSNSLVLKWTGDSEDMFDFSEYMKRKYGSNERIGYSSAPKYNYSFYASEVVKNSKPLSGIKYLIVLNNTVNVRPKIAGQESFEAGATVTKYVVYDIKTGAKFKEGTVVATNSDELGRVPSNMAEFYLRGDLAKNNTKEINKVLFGDN